MSNGGLLHKRVSTKRFGTGPPWSLGSKATGKHGRHETDRGTEKLVERTNDAVRLAYLAGKVRAVYKTKRAFNLPKERIPTPSQSNLIYLFECRHCKSPYVGKTSQRFGERIEQHVPKHLVYTPTSKKRRGRPPKVREQPAEGYQSAIACHLAANEDCRKSFRESAFSILCRCRSKHH